VSDERDEVGALRLQLDQERAARAAVEVELQETRLAQASAARALDEAHRQRFILRLEFVVFGVLTVLLTVFWHYWLGGALGQDGPARLGRRRADLRLARGVRHGSRVV
jgi:hypothetical protein